MQLAIWQNFVRFVLNLIAFARIVMNVSLRHWYLRTNSLFTQLNPQEISELNIISCFKTAQKNDYIYFGGDDLDRLYFVKQGRLKLVSQSETGEEAIVEVLKEEDVFGAIHLQAAPNTRQEYAQALSVVHLCSFTIEDFKRLLARKPELAIEYVKKVGAKLHTARNKFTDLVFKDSKQRISNFFSLHAQHEGKLQPDGSYLLNMFLTHQDIANFTAVSRQTTTKIINELITEQKIIYISRKQVLIPNLKNLQ